MSIIVKDLDNLIIDLCDLESDFFNIMCINKIFFELISDNKLFKQYKQCRLSVKNRYFVNWNKCSITFENLLFYESCNLGLLLFSKYLVSKYIIDIRAWNDYTFIWICFNGHLDTAKWLIELSKGKKIRNKLIDIHAHIDGAFVRSCENGHFDVAKWLIELGKQPGYTPFSDEIILKYYHPK